MPLLSRCGPASRYRMRVQGLRGKPAGPVIARNAPWSYRSRKRTIAFRYSLSTSSCFNCEVQFFEARTGVRSAELPVNTCLGEVAGVRPHGDRRLRRPARGQGPGRKHQAYAVLGSAIDTRHPAWQERNLARARVVGCFLIFQGQSRNALTTSGQRAVLDRVYSRNTCQYLLYLFPCANSMRAETHVKPPGRACLALKLREHAPLSSVRTETFGT